ncbi:hypothetical protein [Pseudomonas chlororaphis]|nr:hypothetical protein [Pseudomonas chlororaphis]
MLSVDTSGTGDAQKLAPSQSVTGVKQRLLSPVIDCHEMLLDMDSSPG